VGGEDHTVRPNIIIHNRKTGCQKLNVLVVECKKEGVPEKEIEDDEKKIRAFMEDTRYEYRFGLQVIYGRNGVWGKLFFKSGNGIKSRKLSASP
jgi:hypothetical protein